MPKYYHKDCGRPETIVRISKDNTFFLVLVKFLTDQVMEILYATEKGLRLP